MNLERSHLTKNLVLGAILLSILPFLLLFFDNQIIDEPIAKLANIFGYIGATVIIWQFIFGIRGVIKRINPDYDWAIKIHTNMGIYGSLFVFLHPIFLKIDRNNSLLAMIMLNFSTPYQTQVSYGKIGIYLFLVIWFTSALARKMLAYRTWLYIHYLTYPMLFFILLHPFQIGSYLQENIFIYTYWLFICGVAITAIILKLLDVLNLSFYKYQITDIKHFPGDIFTITYKPLHKNKIKLFPGQYFYIKNKFVSEAHPFSVFEYNEQNEEITFGIKGLGKYSKQLANSKVGEIHFLDGSFGEFTFEGQNDDPKIFLAGGIGITPFYENIKQFGNDDTYLFFANKNIDQALYRDNFKKILGKNYFDFVLEDLGSKNNVFCELISSQRIREIMSNENLSDFKFFICGSPGFTKTMINCVLELGVPKKNIYIEEFEY
jgi:predicted ferric reductase